MRPKICGPGRFKYRLPGPLLQEEEGVSRLLPVPAKYGQKLPTHILQYEKCTGFDNCGNYVFLQKFFWWEAAVGLAYINEVLPVVKSLWATVYLWPVQPVRGQRLV